MSSVSTHRDAGVHRASQTRGRAPWGGGKAGRERQERNGQGNGGERLPTLWRLRQRRRLGARRGWRQRQRRQRCRQRSSLLRLRAWQRRLRRLRRRWRQPRLLRQQRQQSGL